MIKTQEPFSGVKPLTLLFIFRIYVHHSRLDHKTPEELFSKNKPNLIHLRTFGCHVFIDIPKEKRSKLEPLGKKGIFVGYSETYKAYHIYISGKRNIELSRDVIFDEDTTYKRSKFENESNDEENIEEESSEIERENQIVQENHFENMDLTYIPKEKK